MDLNEYAIEHAVRMKLREDHEACQRRAWIAAAYPPRRWRVAVSRMASRAATAWSEGLACVASALTSPALATLTPVAPREPAFPVGGVARGWLRRRSFVR